MEQIIKHDFLDVYRITDGVLLNVKKYTLPEHYWGFYKHTSDKSIVKKLTGLKNLYKIKKDVDDKWCKVSVGDIIYCGDKIIPTNNPKEYRFEIKTTGECFSGDFISISKYIVEIQDIMDSYLI